MVQLIQSDICQFKQNILASFYDVFFLFLSNPVPYRGLNGHLRDQSTNWDPLFTSTSFVRFNERVDTAEWDYTAA